MDQRIVSHLRDVFLKIGKKMEFSANQYLPDKGTDSTELWYINKGIVRAFHSDSEGNDITLFYVGAGNVIYVESIVPGSTRVQSTQTIMPCEFFICPADLFLKEWNQNGFSTEEIISILIDRLSLLHDHISYTHFKDIRKRLACVLYTNYKRYGPVIHCSDAQIAAISGVNRITANRLLNDFSQEGLLEKHYRQITIRKPEQLLAIYDF